MAACRVAGSLSRVLADRRSVRCAHDLRRHQRRRCLDELRWRHNLAVNAPLERHGVVARAWIPRERCTREQTPPARRFPATAARRGPFCHAGIEAANKFGYGIWIDPSNGQKMFVSSGGRVRHGLVAGWWRTWSDAGQGFTGLGSQGCRVRSDGFPANLRWRRWSGTYSSKAQMVA